jgi:hypothetical protein
MLKADTDAKAASQPKRGADGHLKFDSDGVINPPQTYVTWCLR